MKDHIKRRWVRINVLLLTLCVCQCIMFCTISFDSSSKSFPQDRNRRHQEHLEQWVPPAHFDSRLPAQASPHSKADDASTSSPSRLSPGVLRRARNGGGADADIAHLNGRHGADGASATSASPLTTSALETHNARLDQTEPTYAVPNKKKSNTGRIFGLLLF